MIFVADTMLGKLARWLRILGCNTIYDFSLSLTELVTISNRFDAVFLTRRKYFPGGITCTNKLYISSEVFEEQLRYVVDHFQLDIRKNLFTLCLVCNTGVIKVEKSTVKERVPVQTFDGFNNFYECPKCHRVFWGGGHLTNTISKINRIFKQ